MRSRQFFNTKACIQVLRLSQHYITFSFFGKVPLRVVWCRKMMLQYVQARHTSAPRLFTAQAPDAVGDAQCAPYGSAKCDWQIRCSRLYDIGHGDLTSGVPLKPLPMLMDCQQISVFFVFRRKTASRRIPLP